MPVQSESQPRVRLRIPIWLGLCLVMAIATLFLWEERRAHILGVLPYALLLLCPIIHLFMHRGHGGHGTQPSDHEDHDNGRPSKGAVS